MREGDLLRTRLEITRKTAQLRTDRSIIASPRSRTHRIRRDDRAASYDGILYADCRKYPAYPFWDILLQEDPAKYGDKRGVAIIIQFVPRSPRRSHCIALDGLMEEDLP